MARPGERSDASATPAATSPGAALAALWLDVGGEAKAMQAVTLTGTEPPPNTPAWPGSESSRGLYGTQ